MRNEKAEVETMARVILSGCSGRMGRVITQLCGEDDQLTIVAGVDVIRPDTPVNYPVYDSFEKCPEADVIIDFSSPKAFDHLIAYVRTTKIPAVVCTTGLSQEQIRALEETAKEAAMLRSANMSLGVNLLMKVLSQAAPVLAKAGFDIEIVEKHHNKKKDAPSGTAIALADSINKAMDDRYSYVYGRSDVFRERGKEELGISAVRAGNIPGEHEVIFAGTDEVLTFKHTAYSRAIFGKGALAAAAFLAGKCPGMYTMADVIEAGNE